MSIPDADVDIPPRVRALADGAALIPVWRNGSGGLTFRTDDGRFIKWGRRNPETSMHDEAERIAWAGTWIPVPRVLTQGEADDEEWLVTEALTGISAVVPRWIADPRPAVRAIGTGLRTMHDRLPVASCPWDWSVASRIENARQRGGRIPDDLRTPPPGDRIVVCHGDACAPNTLVSEEGAYAGHVDLGALGVADRWADIAVCAMSLGWNYGDGWEPEFFDAYGITPAPKRMDYYQRLWNAT